MNGKKDGREEGYTCIYGTHQYLALNKDSVSIFVYSYCYFCAVLGRVRLCDPMDYIACQTPLSMEFSRQEYWSG